MSLPRPILDDMPFHIKRKIFEDVPAEYRVPCRLLSKSIKSVIDKMPLIIEDFQISAETRDQSADFYVFHYPTYTQKLKNVHVIDYEKPTKIIKNANYFQVIIDRLTSILAVPNVEFKKFSIKFDDDGRTKYQKWLTEGFSERSIRCKSFSMLLVEDSTEIFRHYLSFFASGYLESLSLSFVRRVLSISRDTFHLEWLMKLPALNNLKRLEIGFGFFCYGIRLEDVKHLKECQLYSMDFTIAEIKELKRMCLQDGKVNFHVQCDRISSNALIAEFGAYTNEKNKTWKFVNTELNSCFKMRAYVRFNDEETRYDIVLEKLRWKL